MSSAAMPATVIGGPLGAGKTTTINTLLRTVAGSLRIAVMVNDFGALPIDPDLIIGQEGDVLTLAGGCVCCSYGSDLMDALTALIGRTPLPDHIVLEASGVALPGTLAASLTLRPEVRLEGVVVLLDASAVLAQVANRWLGDTVERQVREAQLIVLNQADRASEPECVAVRTWLSIVVPGVPVIEAVRGEVPADVLLGPRSAAGPVWFGGPPIAGFEALTLRLKADISVAQINAALMDAGVSLLRVKAIVAEKDGGGWLIQSVGPRIEIGRVLGAPPRSHLTAIARRGHGFETIKPLGTVIDGTD